MCLGGDLVRALVVGGSGVIATGVGVGDFVVSQAVEEQFGGQRNAPRDRRFESDFPAQEERLGGGVVIQVVNRLGYGGGAHGVAVVHYAERADRQCPHTGNRRTNAAAPPHPTSPPR